MADVLGLDTSDMPERDQLNAVRGVVGMLGDNLVAVGELDNCDWHIAGQLKTEYTHGDIEGIATVVGKVSRRWEKGAWKPLLALPGSSLLPRAERRKLERTKPADDEMGNYLEGPALMLDILAIYR